MSDQENSATDAPRADEEGWWQAVLGRDASRDGAFVYGVRSTGIYCRPTCPSRRPRREQVQFFLLPRHAEQAGFRPCRRCRPRERHSRALLVRSVCQEIESSVDERPTLAALSARVGVSPHHLQRTFKQVTGVTPRQYAEAHRLGQFKTRVKNGENVTAAMYDAGYGSSSRLYERAPERLGMTPATYRRGGLGMRIGYTIVDCPLGRLLVAGTERGVCAVSLGDSDRVLEEELAREYPRAEIVRDDAGLQAWIASLVSHLSGRQRDLDLPLDVEATAFQLRVWEALRSIPYGSTRTYSELAREIGQPSAVRAVARACATNPVSIAVPCHRAIRQDGSLAGYRWGLERKQALLERERGESG